MIVLKHSAVINILYNVMTDDTDDLLLVDVC